MAIAGQEVDIVDSGTTTVTPTRGAFALNMLYRHESWEVRRGFGQVAQYDTTMSLNSTGRTQGYRKHLGSTLMRTSFGHDQIVSVFFAHNMNANNLDAARLLNIYVVSIYDITSDTRWEEPMYRHTSELDPQGEDAEAWHAHYETDIDIDNQRWIAAREDEYFFFSEAAINADTDALFFGSRHTGLWVYVPSVFKTARRRFVDTCHQHEWARPYGESSLVYPAGAVVPSSEEGQSFQYFRRDEVDSINVVTALGQRLVYGQDNVVLFSDLGAPAHINTDNFLPIPSDYPITALAEYNGQLLIWTAHETYVYSPTGTNVISGGRLFKVSDSVGCIGPNAWTRVDDLLFFVDTSGVYTYSGQFAIKLASGDVDKFFTDFITNPLTSYFSYNGYTPIQTEQPHTTMQFHPSGVNVSYSAHLRALFVTVPEQNLTMCLSEGKWAVWSYTSSVYVATAGALAASSLPGITQDADNISGFLTFPWLLDGQDDLYLVGSVDQQTFTDEAKIRTNGAAVDIDDDVVDSSYYLLRYGRGGAIDRSVRDEDDRVIAGKYITQTYPPAGVNTLRFYVDPWIAMKKGYVMPNGYVVDDMLSGDPGVWLLPLVLAPPITVLSGGTEVDEYMIHIRFDNTKWKPVVAATSQATETKVDFLLPSERIASAFGYFDPASTPGGNMDATHEVRIYDSGGALDTSGDTIQIAFSGNGLTPASAHGWYTAPSINISPDRRNIMMYIPMRLLNTPAELSGMGLYAPNTVHGGNALPWIGSRARMSFIASAGFIPWEQWTSTSMRKEDSVAQPVDWAYKSARVGDGSQGLKARGCWTTLLSHGKAKSTHYLEPSWLYGMYNIAVASEGKGWVMQVVDATAATPGYAESRDEDTIRTRVLDTSTLYKKTFGTSGNKWGSPASAGVGPTLGTYLIDDQEVDTMATSLSVKGRNFTYMLFGFMQNRAQRIIIESSKALLRVIGGRRRRGR